MDESFIKERVHNIEHACCMHEACLYNMYGLVSIICISFTIFRSASNVLELLQNLLLRACNLLQKQYLVPS